MAKSLKEIMNSRSEKSKKQIEEFKNEMVIEMSSCIRKNHSHAKQLEKAFELCYNNNKEGIKLLSKI